MTRAELPTLEIDLLINTIDLAIQRAIQGYPYDGYLELLYGLDRARTAPPGDGWTVELVEHWEQALRRYARCWLPAN